MSNQPPDKIRTLAQLLGFCALAGLLVAGIALPLVGGLGLAAKATADDFNNLPSELKAAPLSQKSTILDASGNVIASFYDENRIVVPSADIPAEVQKATVAIEDSRFYDHHGVDVKGMIRAFVTNQQSGANSQGGSTITQQYVKNVLLEAAGDNKTEQKKAVRKDYGRKLREARYALALEKKLTQQMGPERAKQEILGRYLNIAYYGHGAYGVAAAARTYFGKDLKDLTMPESAMIAGIVRAPNSYDPLDHPSTALKRRNTVLDRMRDLKYITPAQATEYEQTPLTTNYTPTPNGCETAGIDGYFCDYVIRSLKADPVFGATPQARLARIQRGGLTIKTTLDPRLEQEAQSTVDKALNRGSKYALMTATVEPNSGKIRSLAINRTFGRTGVGATTNPLITGAPDDPNPKHFLGYQAGSTFKMFTLVTALGKGMPLSTSMNVGATYTSSKYLKDGKPWEVHNASETEAGTFNFWTGIAASVNTFFVPLEEQVGADNAVRTVMSMGVTSSVFPSILNYPNSLGSFTLGTPEVMPLEMANAYATLAANGNYCEPRAIDSITDTSGKPVPVSPKSCKQVIDSGVAAAATDALRWVIQPQGTVPHGATGTSGDIGRPVAGKSGTTGEWGGDTGASWFIGYTPQLSTAVALVNPDTPSDPISSAELRRKPVGVFHDFMSQAMAPLPEQNFPQVPTNLWGTGPGGTPPANQGGNNGGGPNNGGWPFPWPRMDN
ncbi:MAG: transglycosylase domain-containing protein [Mycobacteriales bacterium]